MPHSTPNKAFSLIESAIILGVVGLVIGGIWVAAAAVSENLKIQKTTAGILTIVQNARRIFDASTTSAIDEVELDLQNAFDMGIYQGANGFILKGDGSNAISPLDTDFGLMLESGRTFNILHSGNDEIWGKGGFFVNLLYNKTSECMKLVPAITSRFHNNNDLLELDISGCFTDGSCSNYGVTTFPFMPTIECGDSGGAIYMYFALR